MSWLGYRGLVEDDDAVVDVHASNGAGVVVDDEGLLPRMPGMLLIDEFLGELDERAPPAQPTAVPCPVIGVQILDQEDAAVGDVRPERLESADLLAHHVPTVL